MSFLSNLFGSGDAVKAVGDTIDKLFTSDDERLERENERAKAEQNYNLELARFDTELAKGQLEVNKVEAASSSLFVSGWRPFTGWVCGVALAYVGLIQPIASFVARVCFHFEGEFPEVDTSVTIPVLMGMLGLGGMRMHEKVKGVAAK